MKDARVVHITSEDVMEFYRQNVPDFGVRRLFDRMRVDLGHCSGAGIVSDFIDDSANMAIAKLLGIKTIEIGLNKNLDCKLVKPLVSPNEDIPVRHSDELKHDVQIFIDSQSDFDFKRWASSLPKE